MGEQSKAKKYAEAQRAIDPDMKPRQIWCTKKEHDYMFRTILPKLRKQMEEAEAMGEVEP